MYWETLVSVCIKFVLYKKTGGKNKHSYNSLLKKSYFYSITVCIFVFGLCVVFE